MWTGRALCRISSPGRASKKFYRSFPRRGRFFVAHRRFSCPSHALQRLTLQCVAYLCYNNSAVSTPCGYERIAGCQIPLGRCQRARRPSDCNRIAGLCRAGGAFSASSRKLSLHGGTAGRREALAPTSESKCLHLPSVASAALVSVLDERPVTECNPRQSA